MEGEPAVAAGIQEVPDVLSVVDKSDKTRSSRTLIVKHHLAYVEPNRTSFLNPVLGVADETRS